MAERGRARAFLDMLAESRVGVLDEVNPEQGNKETAILARISGIQKELWNEKSSEAAKKREAELVAAEADLEAFHVAVRQSDPRYASIHYPEPVRVSEMQGGLLDEHTALIESARRKTFAGVGGNKKRNRYRDVAGKKVDRKSGERLSQDPDAKSLGPYGEGVARRGSPVRRKALQPDFPADRNSSGVLPDSDHRAERSAELPAVRSLGCRLRLSGGKIRGGLWSLGVGAGDRSCVESPGRGTAENAAGFCRPDNGLRPHEKSTQADRVKTGFERGDEVLAAEDYTERGFSLLPLPYSREEVLSIGKLFPSAESKIYLGAETREEIVKNEKLADFRYVHFASHGFLDETRPGRSGILLACDSQSSEDGILQMDEIMRLKMNADLVTLSACSTGLGKFVNGEGVLGLTRAFFYAGARNVAVSLWNVNDSATATTMENFYRNLNRGLPKGEAMRRAKLAMLRGSQTSWRHPYYWAAFVVQGEGR